MAQISIDSIFLAAIRIQLFEEQALTLVFTPGNLSVKLPTTRHLAEELAVPHYYILPYLAMMEQEDLVTRAERVGIMTTRKGTVRLLDMIMERHHEKAAGLLGDAVLEELKMRTSG